MNDWEEKMSYQDVSVEMSKLKARIAKGFLLGLATLVVVSTTVVALALFRLFDQLALILRASVP